MRRTRHLLTEGGSLHVLGLGDSIVNDTMRSGWLAKLAEAYPKANLRGTVYVRGGGGCQHYKDAEPYCPLRRPTQARPGVHRGHQPAGHRAHARSDSPVASGTAGRRDPLGHWHIWHGRSARCDGVGEHKHSGTGDYGVALKQLAAAEQCAYLDMTTPWAEYIRSSNQHPHVFYRDVVHANEYGEQILTKILLAFLQAAPRSGGAD